LGAVILEKHFTHDKKLPGNDHYHAMDKEDLKNYFKKIEQTYQILGHFKVSSLPNEESARNNARRSLVAASDIEKGKLIEASDLTYKRPATGISPKYIEKIIGKRACQNIAADDVLQWSMFE
jgi:N-acetylneuraminate synthase